MEYNSTRVDLIMPEYGRAIHKMVDHLKTIENREDRNKAALALIDIMGVKNPHLRDIYITCICTCSTYIHTT